MTGARRPHYLYIFRIRPPNLYYDVMKDADLGCFFRLCNCLLVSGCTMCIRIGGFWLRGGVIGKAPIKEVQVYRSDRYANRGKNNVYPVGRQVGSYWIPRAMTSLNFKYVERVFFTYTLTGRSCIHFKLKIGGPPRHSEVNVRPIESSVLNVINLVVGVVSVRDLDCRWRRTARMLK